MILKAETKTAGFVYKHCDTKSTPTVNEINMIKLSSWVKSPSFLLLCNLIYWFNILQLICLLKRTNISFVVRAVRRTMLPISMDRISNLSVGMDRKVKNLHEKFIYWLLLDPTYMKRVLSSSREKSNVIFLIRSFTQFLTNSLEVWSKTYKNRRGFEYGNTESLSHPNALFALSWTTRQ